MKKAVVFVILTIFVIGSCAAQSATADQRIVGTWKQVGNGYSPDGTVWVFNANGTGTYGGQNFFYGISADGAIFTSIYDKEQLYMSPDGRRMYISRMGWFQKN